MVEVMIYNQVVIQRLVIKFKNNYSISQKIKKLD